jgi:hypothetical protein
MSWTDKPSILLPQIPILPGLALSSGLLHCHVTAPHAKFTARLTSRLFSICLDKISSPPFMPRKSRHGRVRNSHLPLLQCVSTRSFSVGSFCVVVALKCVSQFHSVFFRFCSLHHLLSDVDSWDIYWIAAFAFLFYETSRRDLLYIWCVLLAFACRLFSFFVLTFLQVCFDSQVPILDCNAYSTDAILSVDFRPSGTMRSANRLKWICCCLPIASSVWIDSIARSRFASRCSCHFLLLLFYSILFYFNLLLLSLFIIVYGCFIFLLCCRLSLCRYFAFPVMLTLMIAYAMDISLQPQNDSDDAWNGAQWALAIACSVWVWDY